LRVTDVSGNGNTLWSWEFSFASHVYQPDVIAATVPINGLPNTFSIENSGGFPASFTWSTNSNPTTDVEPIKPLAWTIEASIKPTAIDGAHRTFVGRDGNGVSSSDGNLAPLYFQTAPNGFLRINFTDEGGRNYVVTDTEALQINTWYNVAAVSDGTTVRLYKDSGAGYMLVGSRALTAGDTRLAYDDAGSTSVNDTQWGWTLGRGRYGGGNAQSDNHGDRWLGFIDEVRISDAALKLSQMLFSPTNVYVVSGPSPTNVVVPLGAPVSFNIIAGGQDNPRFQWRLNSVNIPNATNETYSIPATIAGQDGNYDVVITNSYSSITSGVAVLAFHTPRTLQWAGVGSTWDTTSANWTTNNGGSFLAYTETDHVLFGTFGLAQPTVVLSGVLTPSSVVVSNGSYSITSGGIAGSGSFSVISNASVILDSANTYSGYTLIDRSTLQVGNGSTGSIGTGPVTNRGALLFSLGADYTITQPVRGGGSITNIGPAGAIFLSQAIDAGYVNMAGAGALVLQATNNSITNGLIISSGVVYPEASGALGNSSVEIFSGAQLYLNFNLNHFGTTLKLAGGLLHKGGGGGTIFGGPVILSADSSMLLDGGATLNLTNAAGISGSGFNLALDALGNGQGIISGPVVLGAGILTRNSGGTWTLAANGNTWSSLNINAGTLQIGNGGTTGNLGSGTIQ
ncbi:MAG: hypothetical protein H7Y43_03180, partial [Akkermansiaceae bacterium]|nr:hypothetical protein [Verrucomicrobiales bacterium]